MRTLEIVRAARLFDGVDESLLTYLAASARYREYPAGRPIILEGDLQYSLFVIGAGYAKAHRATDDGAEVILEIFGPGDYFGEFSFFDGMPRSADVTAIVRTDAVEIQRDLLKSVVHQSPALAWSMLETLCARFRAASRKYEVMTTKDVPVRLADLLLRLVGNVHPATDTTALDIKLSQVEIASFIGATRESVGKGLKLLRSLGLIRQDASGCTVIDSVERLRHFCGYE